MSRFTLEEEDWARIVDRVSRTLGRDPAEVQELRAALGCGELVPAGQILRFAGRPKGVLYNCFVTEANPWEEAHDVAARFTAWTARGAGVGANVSAWCKSRGTEPSRLHELVEAIADSQQRLWESGVTRTATMINVDFRLGGVTDLCRKLATNPTYRHLNVGVVISDESMRSIVDARRTGEKNADSNELAILAEVAWSTGNPGLVFKDTVNRGHPFDEPIDACNPCAEQHLQPGEGCNLASVNLAAFATRGKFDLARFREVVRIGVRMLDATIDASEFPSEISARLALSRRRIGLGVTGFGSALQSIGIDYDSDDTIALANQWALTLRNTAQQESSCLAARAGTFECTDSTACGGMRHSYLTSIAPAGAISLLWGVSSGIEPIFASHYQKGTFEVRTGEATVRAYDIQARRHVDVTAAWQRHIDGGISKTVNLPAHATAEDIVEVFIDAWSKGCKAVSVFRENSRPPSLVITDRQFSSRGEEAP